MAKLKHHFFISCLLTSVFLAILYLYLTKNKHITLGNLTNGPSVSTAASYKLAFEDVNLLKVCENISNIQSRANITFSRLTVIENGGRVLIVKIETFDKNNTRRTQGGDLIVIWANDTKTGSTVAGEVVDQGDGTYIGYIKVLWTGKTVVKAKIVSFYEVSCLRDIARVRYGNSFFAMDRQWSIHGYFKKEGMHTEDTYNEDTLCSPVSLLPGFSEICNFTLLNGNVPYYCGKPRNKELSCSDLVSFGTHYFHAKEGPEERMESIKNENTVLKQSLSIDFNKTTTEGGNFETCANRPNELSWTGPQPPGYWTGKEWKMLNCEGPQEFSIGKYRTCLKNKNLYVIGDSTARQYAKYMIKDVLELGEIDLKHKLGENGRIFHDNTVYTNFNINVSFTKHEMPFHAQYLPARKITPVSYAINSLADNEIKDNTIILIVNYHAHLVYFPHSVFHFRIRRLVQALKQFLVKKPNAKVFFKGNALYDRWQQYSVYKQIIFKEFFELRTRVTYLDDWSVTVAHNNRDLHPVGIVMDSEIQQFMAYICES